MGNTLKGLTELAHPFHFFLLVWNAGVMSGAPAALLDYEATLRLISRHSFSMAKQKDRKNLSF